MSLVLEVLEKLVGFDTVSSKPNIQIIDYIHDFCRLRGAVVDRIPNKSSEKEGLIARFGPPVDGGVILSGHTDVVPTEGQCWTRPDFQLTRTKNRLYGRGTTDMKGFLACMMSAADYAARFKLIKPLTLIFSYDEELGCLGIQEMTKVLKDKLYAPDVCIVGEPTEMQVAIGHKGKTAFRATCLGQAGHSALAPNFVNALYVATDLIIAIKEIQNKYIANGAYDKNYDVPYTTFHVGKLNGGRALNIVPDTAEIIFESRYLLQDGETRIFDDLKFSIDKINTKYLNRLESSAIKFETVFTYPGLDVANGAFATKIGLGLVENTYTTKVAFGTEAGVFALLGLPTIVCGPGSMAEQGHKPDEYITIDQLLTCETSLKKSVERLVLHNDV